MKIKFKLHKNVSPIKFSKKKKKQKLSISKKGPIKIRPLPFSRTLLALRVLINWNEHASKGKKIRGFFYVLSFVKKIKNMYLF